RAALVTVDETQDVARGDGDALRAPDSVQDGGHLAGAPQALGRALPEAVAAGDGQLTNLHDVLLSSAFTRTGSRRIPRRGCGGWLRPRAAPPRATGSSPAACPAPGGSCW